MVWVTFGGAFAAMALAFLTITAQAQGRLPPDFAYLRDVDATIERPAFRDHGARFVYVVVVGVLVERLRRNETEFRLAEKPSKRDVAASRKRLLALGEKYELSSRGRHDARADFLRIDNTTLYSHAAPSAGGCSVPSMRKGVSAGTALAPAPGSKRR